MGRPQGSRNKKPLCTLCSKCGLNPRIQMGYCVSCAKDYYRNKYANNREKIIAQVKAYQRKLKGF